jgi:S-adenosylmethionine/arginine decarboxylase-like enzyme
MATRKKKSAEVTEAVVVKGSHLTVTTYPDGRTELEWDDEALLHDVREALASVADTETIAPTKPKRKAKATK